MNSTQRLLACLRGEVPDRVPISTYELVGWNPEAWENRCASYGRLMDLIRAHTDCMYMCDVPVPNLREGEAPTTVERRDDGPQHVTQTTVHWGGRELTTVTSFSDDVKTVWTTEHPCKDLDDLRAYLALPWEPGEPDFSQLERAWRDLSAPGEAATPVRGLPMVSISDPLRELGEAMEFGNYLVHAITETRAVVDALDCLHERYLERLRRILEGPVKDVVFRLVGPEYATEPYLPPELFRQVVTRYVGQYLRMIQQAGGFARFHCHGRIRGVLGQIAEMNPDALDPIEPKPDGDIGLAEVKRAVGGRMCLMGGLELKDLECADGPRVERLVRQAMEAGKPGGRFVVMPSSAPIDIPLPRRTEENYVRFIETAVEAGVY